MCWHCILYQREAVIRALVTGASGHLGYHICKLLVAEGHEVKAFIRSSSYREHLLNLSVDICFGDVLDINTLKNAIDGVDIVFHTAALYKLTEAEPKKQNIKDDPIIKIAVEGTKNLFQAAHDRNVKKIIYTSSAETVGLTYDRKKLLDESYYARDTFYVYSIAKVESEKIALDLAKKYNLPTVVCNPSTIIGKNDYKLTPSNKMLLNYVKFNSFYVKGGQSLVDVEDVARGHLSALIRGRDMQRYILSGENIEVKDLIILIRKIMNIKYPLFKLNKLFLYPAAFVFEVAAGITNKEPFITRRKVARAVGSYSYYDCSKARKELGYSPKELGEILPSTLTWLIGRYL